MSTANYNFKRVTKVPSSKEFIDIVLSKTQRKTPTIVHKGYHISRIRQFYMKKVKFTQKTMNEKLSLILSDFPRMEDVHPFFGDLMHVLYDRDHYKIALGQVSAVRGTVDHIGRDYVRLMKYGDSLFRCKQLKRAALGRMATALKKLTAPLAYLERVRQHLSRLPSIDPNAKTLLVTGFPNVGKSSFMNQVTRAEVEVQPYAFTTKSLYVGHMDYQYSTWQVIDTPGILDHSLDKRNVIEMQAITALAHIHACVLFFMDLSETCGYNVQQQLSLFQSISPLFTGKPLVVIFNKSDLCTLNDISSDYKNSILNSIEEFGAKWIAISALIGQGIGDVKKLACDLLLAYRNEAKEASGRLDIIKNRLHCAEPIARDEIHRPAQIPDSVLEYQQLPEEEKIKRITEQNLESNGGGPGVYQYNEREYWDLADDRWNNDIMPEFMDGHNIADFIDPEIDARLIELETEEEKRLLKKEIDETRMAHDDSEETGGNRRPYQLADSTIEAISLIKDKLAIKKMQRAVRDLSMRRTRQQSIAIDKFNSRTGSKQSSSVVRGRSTRAQSQAVTALSAERSIASASTKLSRGLSARSASKDRAPSVSRGEGFRDIKQKSKAIKLQVVKTAARRKVGRKGEGDHFIGTARPKHLFSGKIDSTGKRNRR